MASVLFTQPNAEWKWDALADATGLNTAVVYHAHTCGETGERIRDLSPDVVVCALNFPDGDWRQILQLAQESIPPTNVIVVSPHEDIPLYLAAMENGAYDFATLHTSKSDLARILRCAIGNSESRRRPSGKRLQESPAEVKY